MIDLLLVLAFVTYALWSGFAARKDASQGPEEYFLAGRRIPGWKAGLSMAATQYAADTPLVVTGLIATAGVFALWRFWVYSIAFLLMGFLLAPAWRRALILTDGRTVRATLQWPGGRASALREGDLLRHRHQLCGARDGLARGHPHHRALPDLAPLVA